MLTVVAARVGRDAVPRHRVPARDRRARTPRARAVNVALPPGTGDDGWLRAFHAVVPPLLEAFDPQVLVTQQGCDRHADDPLAHLALSIDGQRAAYAALHQLAHGLTGGRWVATGGGGYAWVDVVPRAWAHLVGEVVGRPVDPGGARARVLAGARARAVRAGGTAADDRRPRPVGSAGRAGFDPDDPLDAAILATRRAVFPLHGLARRRRSGTGRRTR